MLSRREEQEEEKECTTKTNNRNTPTDTKETAKTNKKSPKDGKARKRIGITAKETHFIYTINPGAETAEQKNKKADVCIKKYGRRAVRQSAEFLFIIVTAAAALIANLKSLR